MMPIDVSFDIHCRHAVDFTRRMAINIADDCGMSVRSTVEELERIGKIKDGSWSWFEQNGGFTREHFEQARRERTLKDKDNG